MPDAMAKLFECAGDPQTKPPKNKVIECMESVFGGKPDVVDNDVEGQTIVQSTSLDPCTFQRTTPPDQTSLDGPRPGLGRVYAVFDKNGLRAASMKMAFPQEGGGECKPDAVKEFYDKLPSFAQKVEGFTYKHGEVSYQYLGHLTTGELYKVRRDTLVLIFGEDGNKKSPFNPFWDRTQVDAPPTARAEQVKPPEGKAEQPTSKEEREKLKAAAALAPQLTDPLEKLQWAFAELQGPSGCNFEGPLTQLLGKDFAWAKSRCEPFKAPKYWDRWHIGEIEAKLGDTQLKVASLGPKGTLAEVFVQTKDPDQKGIKELEAAWGPPLRYAPNAGAWVVGDYTVRARQAGKNFRVAIVPTKHQDEFSFVVPAADFAPLWR
jgi:hypothetical protein